MKFCNNTKFTLPKQSQRDLDPSYKMDLYLCDYFGRKKLRLITEEIGYYVIIYVSLGISFDEIYVSLDCCITVLWHPINMNYVFNIYVLYSFFNVLTLLQLEKAKIVYNFGILAFLSAIWLMGNNEIFYFSELYKTHFSEI